MFEAIPDQTYKEAGRIIEAACSPDGASYTHAGLPGIQYHVAAAAIALERGAPHLIYDSHATTADRYLLKGSSEWRRMHQAVARAVDQDQNGRALFEEPGDLITHIVSDVVTQAKANRLSLAVRDRNLEVGLSDSDKRIAASARDDDEMAADIRLVSSGLYNQLPAYHQEEIEGDLVTGRGLSPELSKEIQAVSEVIYAQNERSIREMHLAELSARDPAGSPDDTFFVPIRVEAIRKAGELASSPCNTEIGRAISAHVRFRGPACEFDRMTLVAGVDTNDAHSLLARARLVQEFSGDRPPMAAEDMAVRIEADRKLMLAADTDLAMGDPLKGQRFADEDLVHIVMGAYHRLSRRDQAEISERLERKAGVSPADELRMDLLVREIESHEQDVALQAQRHAAIAMSGKSI